MKKVIPVLLLPLLFGLSYGESMKFVTVLSSPVGSFNKLEAVDPKTPAKGSTVNFCTKVGSSGEVQLKGTSAADLKEVVLSSKTTLGKTDSGKYSLSQIKLHKDGNLKGGRLLGNNLTVSQPAVGSSKNLYGTQLTVAGGKTKTLNVSNGASQITEQHGATEMVWSNEYQSDTACKTAGCAKQYLLKQKGSALAGPELDCSDHSYKLAHKSECCPGTSTSDTECWRQECNYKWVDGRTTSSVSGTSGYDNASYPKGYCNPGLCAPTYSGNSQNGNFTGGCISESNARTLLEKVNIKQCSASYVLGNSCGAHQEKEHCYNSYQFTDSGGAPCMHYYIRITSGLMCQKSCSYVKNY